MATPGTPFTPTPLGLEDNLGNRDGHIHVRRYAGDRCFPECVFEGHSGLKPRVMVWGAISYHGRSNLLLIEDNHNNNSTGRPDSQRRMRTGIWQLLPKKQSTASYLSRQLSSATGTTVSRQTVYRRLGHIGLYARRPVRCVPLTATHCRLRLTWSREHAL
ncbi:transposable element Tcb1 transposase [Trichonephila clavipes]|uniref:Transposable element Tcb1 transposase n=1 Tax=Trichonephila clavipes TaxID=2585209 RepID=A0A8X6VU50_TRICX|nr:transposable element Tcb1 transposase [Trichonephila clavipes]